VPLIQQYRGARIMKRRRKEWYREDPGTPEGRDAYRIASKHEDAFARAFLKAQRDMFTPEVERDVKRAIRTGSTINVLDALPVAQDADDPVWEKFREQILRAYSVVIEEAGEDATERMNKKFKTKMKFTLETSEDRGGEEEIVKARADVSRAAAGMINPVNPYSVKWMQERATHLITQGITKSQRDVVTNVLMDGFERGLRAEELYGEIKANVGLTPRWNKAVMNRRGALEAAGFDAEETARRTEVYRERLLGKRAQMIARTETITAQARGRHDAWKIAQDSGQLPQVQRRWIAAPDGCEICVELDGKTAKLGEPYDSIFIGAVDMPGEEAHPS
jgi:hypothetical protein